MHVITTTTTSDCKFDLSLDETISLYVYIRLFLIYAFFLHVRGLVLFLERDATFMTMSSVQLFHCLTGFSFLYVCLIQ